MSVIRRIVVLTTLGLAVTGGVALASPSNGANKVKVDVSVPSVLVSNGRHVWIANTGTSSVLELDARTGAELRNVSGSKYRFDISDGIATYGDEVWVANAASDSVTVFHASTGKLVHVLSGPKFNLEVPGRIVIADKHVFVLNQSGTRMTEIDESTGSRIKVLTGPHYSFADTHDMVVVRNDVWTANGAGAGSLTEFSAATGKVVRIVRASAGHFDGPRALATDGARIWVVSAAGSHLSELNAGNGRLIVTISNPKHRLSGFDSISFVERTVWMASTHRGGLVLGVNAATGATVAVLSHRFGYPAVTADFNHAWIVDRTQSRVTELNPVTGAVIRVITN